MDFVIRSLKESDLRAYVAIRLEALRDHPASFGSSYDDQHADSDETWLARIHHYIDGIDSQIFVADSGTGEFAALLGVYRESGSKIRHAAYVVSVYVRPAYRGRGLVDRLLEAALAWCRERQIILLRLTVTTTNLPAIRCYQRLGFQTTGTLPQYIRTADGAYHDEYVMSRPV
ncbi:MAG TPA: GNAT family N-acetyltransferase [Tepidisphaeraceae bacterium]|jgi:ribosomal protein S18 acetylase RimI-like enzyme|nr:GNAT family N-acetyltransferase [Tepidisphaeraceae bacterium]